MLKPNYPLILLLVAIVTGPLSAGATNDVRVDRDRDPKGNVVYKLTNNGSKNVRVTLQHKKTCASTTTRQEPTKRDYWLAPGQTTRLRKVIANSDCRHAYRVVRAEYD